MGINLKIVSKCATAHKGVVMKRTIAKLAESISDAAAGLGVDAEALADDAGIPGAECIIHLRDCQRCLNAAADALKLANVNGKATANEKPAPPVE